MPIKYLRMTILKERHNLLKSISSGVNAFLKDLEALGLQDRVIGMTISEFGRRIISNASRGTDHGAAAPLMLFGHAIDGGNLLGQNPTIPKEAKDYDNIPMQYDFRSVYGSILEEWFCVNQADVQSALTKTYQKLPIIKSSFGCLTTPTHEETVKAGTNILSVSPNPFVNKISIKLLSDGTYSMVSIFNPGGQIIENIHTGKLTPGRYSRLEFRKPSYRQLLCQISARRSPTSKINSQSEGLNIRS